MRKVVWLKVLVFVGALSSPAIAFSQIPYIGMTHDSLFRLVGTLKPIIVYDSTNKSDIFFSLDDLQLECLAWFDSSGIMVHLNIHGPVIGFPLSDASLDSAFRRILKFSLRKYRKPSRIARKSYSEFDTWERKKTVFWYVERNRRGGSFSISFGG